jgi:hypothetical protein
VKYHLANLNEVGQAYAYLAQLVADKHVVEIKKVSKKRTLSQNNYLHLLLGAFGQHFGYNLEEAKMIYKQLNSSIYFYEKEVRGKTHQFFRSSADISKEDMAKSIDVFRAWSEKAGYPLPLATDKDWLRSIENEIERSKYYL